MTVRVYLWASSQHFADPAAQDARRAASARICSNVVSTSMLFRAMLDALDRWATDGTSPPASRIPTRADGTLVDIAEWRSRFPAIPGVATPRTPNPLPLLDFGPDVEHGILREPPVLVPGGNAPGAPGKTYIVQVPAVDRDGNDVPGVRAPMVAAPLGTYTGWNPRARGFGHGMQLRFEGSYIPFAETAAECAATGDPRPSILERYPDKACLCRCRRRSGAGARGAGVDAGRGRRTLRHRRRRLGPAAARRIAGVVSCDCDRLSLRAHRSDLPRVTCVLSGRLLRCARNDSRADDAAADRCTDGIHRRRMRRRQHHRALAGASLGHSAARQCSPIARVSSAPTVASNEIAGANPNASINAPASISPSGRP